METSGGCSGAGGSGGSVLRVKGSVSPVDKKQKMSRRRFRAMTI